MYHLASSGPIGNSAKVLEEHFAFVAGEFSCVLPGEALDSRRSSICLTFDDAFFDFYAVVYPLLRKYGLRALVAVPVFYVREVSTLPSWMRLRACNARDDACANAGGHLTWCELAEMVATGTVLPAAHGFTHRPLDDPRLDLQQEVVLPQLMLTTRLGRSVESFVLPYGRLTRTALNEIRKHYKYVFRIGNADNRDWNSGILYRFSADELSSATEPFSPRRQLGRRLRRTWNRVRGR
jgi:peptidoglycan/xylan/chitin deacetylase (PgdA/CDA1 family)